MRTIDSKPFATWIRTIGIRRICILKDGSHNHGDRQRMQQHVSMACQNKCRRIHISSDTGWPSNPSNTLRTVCIFTVPHKCTGPPPPVGCSCRRTLPALRQECATSFSRCRTRSTPRKHERPSREGFKGYTARCYEVMQCEHRLQQGKCCSYKHNIPCEVSRPTGIVGEVLLITTAALQTASSRQRSSSFAGGDGRHFKNHTHTHKPKCLP